jgi:hypothetical protein
MRSPLSTNARIVAALALVAAVGCGAKTEVPATGNVLLRVTLGAGAAMPDELRAFVYDGTGALWNDARFPSQGALVPESATLLGTILIQPGTTAGDLRIDLRGLLAGAQVDEGTLKIPAAQLSGGTFDLTLEATLPADSDGDGVPDPIDDCPSVRDPIQAGCSADGGGTIDGATGRADAAEAGRDAAADARVDGPAVRTDAARDAPRGNKGTGSGCGGAAECASGFCTDGVCCKTACTDPCNSCVTGTCNAVKNGEDDPECIAPMTCDKKGKCVAATSGGN